ncbi:MAG: right-handed parallel beta-helix repeat-containing protein [Kiritimatiellae bacterium]|nr:right-handed parallel beta-helix repeat-containing protein [Kiritimatiellia bacterium]
MCDGVFKFAAIVVMAANQCANADLPPAEPKGALDIRDFGAAEDAGPAANMSAIQKALDKAGESGGGVVVVPPGVWNTGTLWLRSHTELRLEKGAVLKGSGRREDYNANDAFPENFWDDHEEWSGGHLILGYKVEHTAITGDGVIDGNGPAFFGECDEDSRFPYYKYGLKLHPTDREWFRPGHMVAFFLSRDIRIEGVTLAHTPAWTAHFRCCDGLAIRNVTIAADRTIANSDGISIDCTRNATVSGCTIKTGDDGFAIRASCRLHAADHPCENIRISDCDVWSCCYGVRFGVGSGTVRNITVENCRFHESSRGIGFMPAWTKRRKNVYIENIRVAGCTILECGWPVAVVCPEADARVRDVLIENCRMESLLPCDIGGNGICHAENFVFRNCSRRNLATLRIRNHRGWVAKPDLSFAVVRGPGDGVRMENCEGRQE